jgi:hypothetical protein
MPWFSIRAVYIHGRDSDGSGIFAERILLFCAPDVERAFELAESESRIYLQFNPAFQRVGEWIAFSIRADGEQLNGAEIWSALSSSDMEPDQYYERRYTQFELQPEEDDSTAG